MKECLAYLIRCDANFFYGCESSFQFIVSKHVDVIMKFGRIEVNSSLLTHGSLKSRSLF